MPNAKLRYYYWRIYSYLTEHKHLLLEEHPDYLPPDEDLMEHQERLGVRLVFVDGSCLIAYAWLDTTAEVKEYNYVYVYLDPQGKRIFQYDDSPHHPGVPTHPHHLHKGERPLRGKDPAHELDIPQVDFMTVMDKIIREYLQTHRRS